MARFVKFGERYINIDNVDSIRGLEKKHHHNFANSAVIEVSFLSGTLLTERVKDEELQDLMNDLMKEIIPEDHKNQITKE